MANDYSISSRRVSKAESIVWPGRTYVLANYRTNAIFINKFKDTQMNELEKNMKRIGTKNISEQDSGREFVSTSQKQLQLLQELVEINRKMLIELQKMPKRI